MFWSHLTGSVGLDGFQHCLLRNSSSSRWFSCGQFPSTEPVPRCLALQFVATAYFSTLIRLLEEFLLDVCKVEKKHEERLRSRTPQKLQELFWNRPVVVTLDYLHWEMEAPSDHFARKVAFSHYYWDSPAGKALIPLSTLGA
eukprot:4276691-Pleurochrysis_carterae.AAC.1